LLYNFSMPFAMLIKLDLYGAEKSKRSFDEGEVLPLRR